ncbi:MAG: aminotransferase class I/II-fold pyridoxal phosphate-dependent enzyme [Myxococcales bacterium]|nr:aminotransferase class I/II-fold pyridoxal phosphate-dependent enzyme [Myxococcales bacterium]
MPDKPSINTPAVPLTRPWLGAEEQAAVAAVLGSGMLVQGAEVAAFEGALAELTGRAHAIAVSNGTSALLLALEAAGVGPGDGVLCPDLTWPSPAHAITLLGAEPQLVAVDADEWNAGPEAFAAARDGRSKAAIAIDQFGNPARAEAIAEALPGLTLIVDAACSLGSELGGGPCGRFGTIACSSFHPRKVITTGEGGVCLTDDPELAQRLRILRNHGQRGPGDFARAAGNHRLTEFAAAIGRVQLLRLPEIVARRRALAERYLNELPALGLQPQRAAPDARPNHQTFGVLLPPGRGAAERAALVAALAERGVQSGLLSYALHQLPQFAAAAERARQRGIELSTSASIALRGLSLPLFPTMDNAQQQMVVDALADLLP